MRYSVLLRVFVHHGGTTDAQPRLYGAGRVIDPAVNNPRVVPGLMRGDVGFLLNDDDRRSWPPEHELARNAEAYDASANDGDVLVEEAYERVPPR